MAKRILLTGGGTGGHIFPLLAVADEFAKMNYTNVELLYIGPDSPWKQEFSDRSIKTYRIASSKLRRYFSLANFIDIPKFIWSFFQALFRLYFLMPDVIFSKGGPGALAVVLAAKFYTIPIIIHESDTMPGLSNRLSAKFAKRIGVAFESAAKYFSAKKVFVCGNPIRHELLGESVAKDAAKGNLGFKKDMELLFVWGGSQGAARLNRFIFENLETFLGRYQIFHQVGGKNLKEVQTATQATLSGFPEEERKNYRLAGFLDANTIKMAMSAADVVISRASAGSIFEVAAIGKPCILVPIPTEIVGDHQLMNAYEYAKTGAAVVIEEANLTPNLVLSQIDDILKDKNKYAAMSTAAKKFSRPDSASIIVQELLKIG